MRELYAELGVVSSLNIRHIRLDADVIQTARLAESHRLIGKRIGAREVLYVIETVIRIDREHGGRAENVNIARCNVNAVNKLSLILAEGLLIKLIRRLETVASEEQIQVKRVLRVRAVVDAIKNA